MIILRWIARVAVILAVILAAWITLDTLTRPVSTLMVARVALGKPMERRWIPLSDVSPHLKAAVILSEDGRFCHNSGVDWAALRSVLHGRGVPARGASTLTMQVAKNLFLWPGRSYLRKAVEVPLALLLDAVWSKKRILEYYFNIAEWGDGQFGVEAASQNDFHVAAKDVTPRQAVLLATALPNPLVRRPDRPPHVQRLVADRLLRLLPESASHVSCVQ